MSEGIVTIGLFRGRRGGAASERGIKPDVILEAGQSLALRRELRCLSRVLLTAKAIAAKIRTVYPGHGSSFPGSAIAAIEL